MYNQGTGFWIGQAGGKPVYCFCPFRFFPDGGGGAVGAWTGGLGGGV